MEASDIAIELITIAIVLPIGLVLLADANLTGVNTAVVTVVTVLLPVLAVVSIARKWMKL